MRVTRAFTWLAAILAAVAVSAAAAGSASALSVVNESSGTACSTLTPPISHGPGSGGCAFQAAGTSIEFGTALGMVTCDIYIDARIGPNGVGVVYIITLVNCSPVTVTACTAPEPPGTLRRIWNWITGSETTVNLTYCVTMFGITVNCTLNGLTLSQNAAHTATLSTGASHKACTTGGNSLQGTLTSITDASHPAIEFAD